MRKQEAPRRILLAAALFGVAACTRPSEIETPPAPPLVQPAKSENIPPIKPAFREPPLPMPKAPESPEFRFSGKWIVDFRLQNVDNQGRVITNKDGAPQWKPAESVGADGKKKQLTSEYFLPTARVVVNPQTNIPEVLFELNDEGSRLLEGVSKSNVGRPLVTFVDGKIVAPPTILSAITRVPGKPTQAVISGLNQDVAYRLVERLNTEAINRLLKVFPIRFEVANNVPAGTNRKKTEEGWKWVLIELGFENVGTDPLDAVPAGLTRDQFQKAKLLTSEGFLYELYDRGNHTGYCSHLGLSELTSSPEKTPRAYAIEEGLPQAFRMRGVYWSGTPFGGIYSPRLCFKVAEKTSVYRLQVPGFSAINLEENYKRVQSLSFPTDRPESDYKELSGSFSIPNKGTLTFLGIQRVRVAGWVGKAGDDDRPREIEGLKIRARFDNASLGYNQDFSVGLKIFDNAGVLYPSGLSVTVGPGLSKETAAIIPARLTSGKIVATGDLNDIFNLNLSSVQEAKPSILKAGYFERCTDCGASFKVDDLEILQDKLRIPITIQNTGESGKLEFDFSSSSNKVYIFDSAQAAKFKDAFRETNAFRRTELWPILFGAIHPLALIISPEPNTKTPAILPVGKEWRGSLEAKSDSLPPKDKIAAILVSLVYSSDKQRAEAAWVSYDDTRPFIEIKR